MIEITPEIRDLIQRNAVALAAIDPEGKPHCIAVGDVKVVSQNQVLIGDNYMVETTRNIQNNKNVSLVVWCDNWKETCTGYELRGTAEYFKEGKWREMIKKSPQRIPCKRRHPCHCE
ncbi:pyridoxamine 5'-phosphate oxidase family protein [Candidatus Woesearchaeota archaeon]|nr:pyridoxamine 5'-phosphate oxidase family protein [Candidatus Woesearchaeota archaeon]